MSLPKQAARRGFRAVSHFLAVVLMAALFAFSLFASEPPGRDVDLVAPPARGVHDRSPLIATPGNLAFGDVATGSSRSLSAAVINTSKFSITISAGKATGHGFSLSGIHLPLILGPGERYSFSVTFRPTSIGKASGSITATGSFRSTLTIPLTANGTPSGELLSWPMSINFGSVPQGATAQRTAMLIAVGGPVTVYGASSDSVQFLPAGLPSPFVLSEGQSVAYRVIFSPQKTGKSSALLSFKSSASNSPGQLLDGQGEAPQSYTVELSWQPSASPVVGYNIYRGVTSGGPYSMINSGLDPLTNYQDNHAAASQTYYYVTTSVNAEGLESQYSNEVEVTTP
jgi:hypothetical protein